MKRVEFESFSKSFMLFFLSMGILLGVLFFINYKKELEGFDKALLNKMHLCSYSLDCKEFNVDFQPKSGGEVCYVLFKEKKEIFSLYPINKNTNFCLKLYLDSKEYHQQIHYLHKDLILQGLITLLIIILLSIFFSFYTLNPLRNALLLTREFVKDILHDFNTPISTIRLNLSLIEEEFGGNKQINRIERSIDNVLLLQENLRNYVHSEKSIKEEFNLLELLKERVEMIERNYSQLNYSININVDIILYTHKKDFIRIIDNLIGNASKYNKVNGSVIVNYITEKNILSIKDTGKGIQHPNKVFERFYKEHERGLGIGLHIVKKLCDELAIKIKLETILDKETIITLNIKQIKARN